MKKVSRLSTFRRWFVKASVSITDTLRCAAQDEYIRDTEVYSKIANLKIDVEKIREEYEYIDSVEKKLMNRIEDCNYLSDDEVAEKILYNLTRNSELIHKNIGYKVIEDAMRDLVSDKMLGNDDYFLKLLMVEFLNSLINYRSLAYIKKDTLNKLVVEKNLQNIEEDE